eukprot:s154_g86.t1
MQPTLQSLQGRPANTEPAQEQAEQVLPALRDTDRCKRTSILLVTEEFHEYNAGFVVGVSDLQPGSMPSAGPFMHELSPNDIVQSLKKKRENLLKGSTYPDNPTTAVKSGLLLTPFLGVRADANLDLLSIWAIYGEFAIKAYWPIPDHWEPGQPWPRTASIDNLDAQGRARQPPFNRWARGTFEQAALALLTSVEGTSIAKSLPGAQLFQAHKFCQSHLRPAIYHSFGGTKLEAPEVLAKLATEGWQALLACILGIEDRPAAWQSKTWCPIGGMQWTGLTARKGISAELRAALLLRWTTVSMQIEPQSGLFPASPLFPLQGLVNVPQPVMHDLPVEMGNEEEKEPPIPSRIKKDISISPSPMFSDEEDTDHGADSAYPAARSQSLRPRDVRDGVPHLTLAGKKVDNTVVYGPTLTPVDQQATEELRTGLGLTVLISDSQQHYGSIGTYRSAPLGPYDAH